MGYQTAPHGSLGLPGGLYQFMAFTEGTALPFGSEWVLYGGSATEQNCVQDYIIFAILSRLHQDYTRFAQRLHIFVVQELTVISSI